MKQILLTPLYPFWFFFSKTWFGGVLLICFLPVSIGTIICLFMLEISGGNSQGIGMFGAIVSIPLSFVFAIPLFKMGCYLEKHYEKWNYKTEMETKMI